LLLPSVLYPRGLGAFIVVYGKYREETEKGVNPGIPYTANNNEDSYFKFSYFFEIAKKYKAINMAYNMTLLCGVFSQ